MNDTDPICIIPASGISSGLPKKNFKRIDSTPLVAHTIKSALETETISNVVVSTESNELANISREYGAQVPFLRDRELSQPDVLLKEVVKHSVSRLDNHPDFNIEDDTPLVVLQPNVPFTRPVDIDAAVDEYRQNGQHAVISVVEEREFFWRATNDHLEPLTPERVLRSELEPMYRETGSIYVTNRSILENGDRVGIRPSYLVTDKLSSFEVDSVLDIWLAEKIVEGPRVVFRVDGGDDIGMGHIYRCEILARKLRAVLDCKITFLTKRDYPAGIEKLESQGYDVVVSDSGGEAQSIRNLEPDIIFIDSLDTSEDFIRDLHDLSAAVINLEDLGDGADHADYVINALYEETNARPNQLFGADYLVFEDEFDGGQSKPEPDVEKVLLTFGGSDPSNLSTRIAEELGARELPYQYRLVLGPDFTYEQELAGLPDSVLTVFEIQRNVSEMSDLMHWADVAICSGGRTVYELAAVGVPSIVIAHNARETDRMEDLASLDIVEFLGTADALEDGAIADRLRTLDEDYERRVTMSENACEFVDNRGVQRILDLVHDAMIG